MMLLPTARTMWVSFLSTALPRSNDWIFLLCNLAIATPLFERTIFQVQVTVDFPIIADPTREIAVK